MGLTDNLLAVVSACCAGAEIPTESGCCGFAGDRGYLEPALTAATTAPLVAALADKPHTYFCSSSRTCEIGLERATGQPWRSWLYLLAEAAGI